MDKAIFLDRDGVINELIYSEERKEFEPPFFVKDLKIISGVIESLKLLQQFNYRLILISNQPDYAKGKTSLENLMKVHDEIHKIFSENKIKFSKYNYCYHHPNGIVKDFAVDCECRKPKTYFVLQAIKEFNLDIKKSWFIGDRDTDIQCGRAAGINTILIENSDSKVYRKNTEHDFRSNNLKEVVKLITGKEI